MIYAPKPPRKSFFEQINDFAASLLTAAIVLFAFTVAVAVVRFVIQLIF